MTRSEDELPGPARRANFLDSDLNLKRLRYFVTVAQELHFGRAAARLGISQPPLSLQIRELEYSIGVSLFRRTSRRVSLTAAGRILFGQANALLAHAERVGQVMQGVGAGSQGEILVGCVPSALYKIFPQIVGQYRRSYPEVHLILKEGHTAEIMASIRGGQLDVGLVWGGISEPPLQMMPILEESFCAILPRGHALTRERALSLEALAGEPLILPPRKMSPYHYDHIVSSFEQRGLHPRTYYEVTAILSQIGFVACGLGIAIAPSFARHLISADVEVAAIDEEMPAVILSLVWNGDNVTPPVTQFIETVAAGAFHGADEPASPPEGQP